LSAPGGRDSAREPLSPLLSNILLDELDKELQGRGHRFARYADDVNVYVVSKREGERVMASPERFLKKSLRDIECCLRAHHAKLYHIGIRSSVSRSTLAHANDRRDWRIWADFAPPRLPLLLTRSFS
jgi:hypothetical protein